MHMINLSGTSHWSCRHKPAPCSDQRQVRCCLSLMSRRGRIFSTFSWQMQCNCEDSIRTTRLVPYGLRPPRKSPMVFSREVCQDL